MIRLLLVDDQNLIREGLKALLDLEPDLQVVGDADTGHSAIQQVETLKPDVVLLDLCVPRIDGIATTQIICDRFPKTQVLVLTTLDDEESVANALKVGATGYLLKDLSPEELVGAVRNVHKGYTQLSPGILPKILSRVDGGAAPPALRLLPAARCWHLTLPNVAFLAHAQTQRCRRGLPN
ncbi:MAG: response regulator transcription factor [Leptolyngbyaceae cyanobacterium CSU_1_3]|nr:response regulator transcription factor [Leptolyngbyaceae cyanobacterium CSU_1_3]